MQYKVLPHAAIVISIMYFVFFFIDKVNQPMAFINNDITKGLLFVLCVISILNAISLIRVDRRRERQRQSGADRQSASDRRSASDRQQQQQRRPNNERRSEPYPRSYSHSSTRRYDSPSQDRLSRYR